MGLDRSPHSDADLIHDLDTFPYPIEDDAFDQILCQWVFGYLHEPIGFMRELHRIGRDGARIQINTPHFSSLHAHDLGYQRRYSARALRSFETVLPGEPGPIGLRAIHVTLVLWTPYRAVALRRLPLRAEEIYERYLAYILPSMTIHAEFEVVKRRECSGGGIARET